MVAVLYKSAREDDGQHVGYHVMTRVPDGLRAKYDVWLEGHAVQVGEHEAYRKWLRFYLDFCRKYGPGYALSPGFLALGS